MNNKRNKDSGITLIALVITIIVLLILAGVSIATLTGNNGLLQRATDARNKTKDSELEERVKLSTMASMQNELGKINEETLKIELKRNIEGITDSNITGSERDGWQVKVGEKAFVISKEGEVNEAYWEEVRAENGDVTEIRRVDGKVTGLKIGDTIGYNMLDGASTTEIQSSQSVNGYKDKTIKLSDYKGTWRLLGVEKGKLNLISSGITGVPKAEGDGSTNGIYTNLYFKLQGRTGYQNAENELNRICGLYGNGKYAESARSINVDDINKITGYDPEHTGVNVNKATKEKIEAGTKYGDGQLYQYGNQVTYEWDGTEKPKYTSNVTGWKSGNIFNHSIFYWWDGSKWQKSDYTGAPGKICMLRSDSYSYYPETLTTTNDTKESVGLANDSILRELLFDSGLEQYWLASKCVITYSGYVNFDVRRVSSGYVTNNLLVFSSGVEGGVGIGLRPIVTLKSDIQLKKDESGIWQISE